MMHRKMLFYWIIKTRIGNIALIWYKQGLKSKIIKIMLSVSSAQSMKKNYQGIQPGKNKMIARIELDIKRYIAGEKIHFSLKNLEFSGLKSLAKRVLLVTSRIPRGKVETYGSIARKLKIPKGARAVGQALARNPFPIIIPCHRVIRSDGTIGGFGGGTELKRKLLSMEGVEI
ncbi:MAG: methylated-DNA--[protein]-cysteine S-methyltransferase [candidate division WOR-3 bacterium]|nr:methylated-DNA--[protein]-cysteine S-methyltransferase [candidate division WOR-3 bacterium]